MTYYIGIYSKNHVVYLKIILNYSKQVCYFVMIVSSVFMTFLIVTQQDYLKVHSYFLLKKEKVLHI